MLKDNELRQKMHVLKVYFQLSFFNCTKLTLNKNCSHYLGNQLQTYNFSDHASACLNKVEASCSSLIRYIYRVSHRYCCNFEVNFTKSGTRYLQKDNVLVKFGSFSLSNNLKTSKKSKKKYLF